jgi:GT2 family glycosyltransferase
MPRPRHVVTVVIVTHDGARLLPGLVQGITEQTHPVARAIGVDTGSRDRSGALLAELIGADAVFGMEAGTGYGAAVYRALRQPAARPQSRSEDLEWVWLLHDDCQPEPDALEQMLRVANRSQTVAILGPKLRDLNDRRVLRETGLAVDRAGRRLTGIEPGEIDQGQHDGNRGVLAVSTAGMLVRRDVWDQLGGFDPLLPLFRDDIDFCWRAHAAGHDVRVVTDAVVYHRELSARQIRKAPAAGGHPRTADRRAALYVFAANLPFAAMLAFLGGCIFGSLMRAAYFLLTKQQRRAFAHLGAIAWLLSHPVQIWRARRRRAADRKRGYAVLKPKIPHARTLSRLAEGLASALSRNSPYEGSGEHGGVTDNPDDELPLPPPDSLIRRVLTHPSVLLLGALLVVTVIAEHSLLGSVFTGSGTLAGGALVPAWGGASDLWREYLAGYHPVGVGSAASAPPYIGVIAAVATVLGGKPWLAVDVLLLGCVPVAGMGAYLASRRVTPALAPRIWIAFSYALLPVATGAIAAGRLGSAVVFMLLPPIGVMLGRMLTRPPRIARRAAWAAGLLIAIATAFVPLIWLIVAAWAVGTLFALGSWRLRGRPAGGQGGWAMAINAAIVAAVPAVILMPWTFHLVANPSAFLLEAGVAEPGLAVAGLRPAPLLLLNPGGPGMPPVWVTAGLVAAAFCALLVRRRTTLVLAGWGIALTGLIAGAIVGWLRVTSPVSGGTVPAWPGIALTVAAAGLLLAATPMVEWAAGLAWGVAASEASLATRAKLVGRRGMAGLAIGLMAVTVPVLAAGYWLATGVRGPLSAAGTPVLPAFIAASSGAPYQNRTLVLRQLNGVLTYQLLRDSDPVLGDQELPEAASAATALNMVVASLAAPDSGDAEDAGQALSNFDVGSVLLPAPVDQTLAVQLNGEAGLQPLTVSSSYDLWRVAGTVARVSVITPGGTVVPVPAGEIGSTSTLASGVSGTLVLAEPAGGWSATLNGHALRPVAQPVDGWAQGFVLPAGGGRLVVSRNELPRDLILAIEALAVLVAFALALPGTRAAAATAASPAQPEPAEPGPHEQTGPMSRPRTTQPQPSRRTGPLPTRRTGAQPAHRTGPQPAHPTGPQPSYGTGPQPVHRPEPEPAYGAEPAPAYWSEPQPAYRTGPQPSYGTGPQPAYETGPRPSYGTGPQPTQHAEPEPAYHGDPWATRQTAPEQQPPRDSHRAEPTRAEPTRAEPGRAEPTRAEPRKGGSHRASRHSKPSRGWRGGSRGAGQDNGQDNRDGAQEAEGFGPDLEKLSDDLTLAMPKLFASPGDGGMMPPAVPPAVSEAPQDAPWGRAEDPDAEAVRAPWELP